MLDAELLKRIVSVEKVRLGLCDHLIQLKAENIHNDLLLTEHSYKECEYLAALKFSRGYLYAFQFRHKLISRRMHGEAGSVSQLDVEKGRRLL